MENVAAKMDALMKESMKESIAYCELILNGGVYIEGNTPKIVSHWVEKGIVKLEDNRAVLVEEKRSHVQIVLGLMNHFCS